MVVTKVTYAPNLSFGIIHKTLSFMSDHLTCRFKHYKADHRYDEERKPLNMKGGGQSALVIECIMHDPDITSLTPKCVF
jgi:hypothetical protein